MNFVEKEESKSPGNRIPNIFAVGAMQKKIVELEDSEEGEYAVRVFNYCGFKDGKNVSTYGDILKAIESSSEWTTTGRGIQMQILQTGLDIEEISLKELQDSIEKQPNRR